MKDADTGTEREVYGFPRLPVPEPESPELQAEVERQLRIADSARHADRMWARILADYAAYSRTLVFVACPRK